jgi:hypothetical protein
MALRCIDALVDPEPDAPGVGQIRIYKHIDDRFPRLDMVLVDVEYLNGGVITYYVLRDHLPTITALCDALNIKQR